jgi:hypothetical protein
MRLLKTKSDGLELAEFAGDKSTMPLYAIFKHKHTHTHTHTVRRWMSVSRAAPFIPFFGPHLAPIPLLTVSCRVSQETSATVVSKEASPKER